MKLVLISAGRELADPISTAPLHRFDTALFRLLRAAPVPSGYSVYVVTDDKLLCLDEETDPQKDTDAVLNGLLARARPEAVHLFVTDKHSQKLFRNGHLRSFGPVYRHTGTVGDRAAALRKLLSEGQECQPSS